MEGLSVIYYSECSLLEIPYGSLNMFSQTGMHLLSILPYSALIADKYVVSTRLLMVV
jgi:hypothetical protein